MHRACTCIHQTGSIPLAGSYELYRSITANHSANTTDCLVIAVRQYASIVKGMPN
jgi:hypothetical protein